MEALELQTLFNNYHRKIAKIDTRFKRYLYDQINWDARIIGNDTEVGHGNRISLWMFGFTY
jgi:hypothetical protein